MSYSWDMWKSKKHTRKNMAQLSKILGLLMSKAIMAKPLDVLHQEKVITNFHALTKLGQILKKY